jgi:uncharacterized protein (TIGR04255 family)
MNANTMKSHLPDYDAPPVMEIVGAAQFVALPRLDIPDVVKVGSNLGQYEFRDLQPELPPMSESPPGNPDTPQFMMGFGNHPPPRAMYEHEGGRFVAQLQRDRIAINERRDTPEDPAPSSKNVGPELERFAKCVSETLVADDALVGPTRPTLIEVTYVNLVEPAEGVWENHGQLDRVLRIFNAAAGDQPWADVEQSSVNFSFPLYAADNEFEGRLHVIAEPAFKIDLSPVFRLNLFSRRIVQGDDPDRLASVFEQCHEDVVEGFTAITTSKMHDAWGRKK